MDLKELAANAAQRRASDLFLKENASPTLRVDGKVVSLDLPPLTATDTRDLAYSIMTPEQIGRFERRHELDLAFTIGDIARFRANVYQQRGSVGMVLRIITLQIYSLEQLGMPQVIADLCKKRQGLVLVTGPTGCGK